MAINYNFSNLNGENLAVRHRGFPLRAVATANGLLPGWWWTRFATILNGVGAFGARDTLPTAASQPGVQCWIQSQLNRPDGNYDGQFFDFRLGRRYDLTPDNLLYVMFSTAHKSGGFNDQIRLPRNSTRSVAPTLQAGGAVLHGDR